MTMMQVYAPTSTHSDEGVEMFCEHTKRDSKVPKKDILTFIGNFIAKMGPDTY